MPFLEHVRELRKRVIISLIALLVGGIASFVFYDFIVDLLKKPFENAVPGETQLYVYSVLEGFIVKIKVSIFSGGILSFPVHLYNIIRFFFPALTKNEKKLLFYILIASGVLILGSSYFSYSKLIPLSIHFLVGGGFIPQGVGTVLNYGQNITYIFQFFLFSLLLFQLPVVVVILMKMRIVSRRFLLRSSRYFVVAIFVLAALVTPPDPISQLSLALPLVVLFYGTIFIAHLFRFGEE